MILPVYACKAVSMEALCWLVCVLLSSYALGACGNPSFCPTPCESWIYLHESVNVCVCVREQGGVGVL